MKWQSSCSLLVAILCSCKPAVRTEPQSHLGGFTTSAFTPQEWTAPTSGVTLKLISTTEAEFGRRSEILLGQYSRQDNVLRLVVSRLGTPIVMYFNVLNDGEVLRAQDGSYVLLAPKTLQAHFNEVSRIADLEKKSVILVHEVFNHEFRHPEGYMQNVRLYDAGVVISQIRGDNYGRTVLFRDLSTMQVSARTIPNFVAELSINNANIGFASLQQLDEFVKKFDDQFNHWHSTYAELFQNGKMKRVYQGLATSERAIIYTLSPASKPTRGLNIIGPHKRADGTGFHLTWSEGPRRYEFDCDLTSRTGTWSQTTSKGRTGYGEVVIEEAINPSWGTVMVGRFWDRLPNGPDRPTVAPSSDAKKWGRFFFSFPKE